MCDSVCVQSILRALVCVCQNVVFSFSDVCWGCIYFLPCIATGNNYFYKRNCCKI